jgi:hypothetical protein
MAESQRGDFLHSPIKRSMRSLPLKEIGLSKTVGKEEVQRGSPSPISSSPPVAVGITRFSRNMSPYNR